VLCKEIGFPSCDFKIGAASRQEIISHFEQHNTVNAIGNKLQFQYKHLQNIEQPRNPRFWVPILVSPECTEDGPLFIITLQINVPTGFASWACVKVWGMNQHAPQEEKYQVEISIGTGTADTSSVKLSWKLNVHSLNDTEVTFQKSPVHIPLDFIFTEIQSPTDSFLTTSAVFSLPTTDSHSLESEFKYVGSVYPILVESKFLEHDLLNTMTLKRKCACVTNNRFFSFQGRIPLKCRR